MKTTASPHDVLFKQFLAHPETAHDLLQRHLPPAVLDICDLSTLRLESGSMIEEELRACYSDVLYSLRIDDSDGYVFFLIDHQSSPDRNTAFRLLKYALDTMQRHLDAGHDELPVVVPVLLYHGQVTPYPWSLRWLDAFDDPELVAKFFIHAIVPLAQEREQEGDQDTTLKIARAMLACGLDRDAVMHVTGLSASDLARIYH